MSPFKFSNQIHVDQDYRAWVYGRARNFIDNSKAEKIVFSSEGLSYLRHDDELFRLRQLFKDERVYVLIS